MLIRKVILEDFGLYRGQAVFDLAPRVKRKKARPIVLFGGKNGAGKTTLLDAIRLALYGKGSLGPRVSQKDYEAFLRGCIHRPQDELLPPTYAAASIEFEHVSRGQKDTYLVERAWEARNGDGAMEQLTVHKNGQLLEDVDPEFWGSFIQDIVPERLAQVFFFDGEKIKSIAEDDTGAAALADSIKSLLGLDIVDRLKADLSIYSSRVAQKLSKGRDMDALRETEEQIERIQEKVQGLNEELRSATTESDGIEAEIRRKEEFLRSQGYAYAQKRSELQTQDATLETELESLEKDIRQECEHTFPLSLCPTVAALLKEQLTTENELLRWSSAKDELKLAQKDIKNTVTSAIQEQGNQLNGMTVSEVEKVINMAFARRTKRPAHLAGVKAIHQLSENEMSSIHAWLDAAANAAAPRVKDLAQKIARTCAALRDVKVNLGRVPDESHIRPHVEELNELNQQLGSVRQRYEQLEMDRASAINALADLERRRDVLVNKQEAQEGAEGRLGLAKSVRDTLSAYGERITNEKIKSLRSAVAECFNRLCRKEDMIREIDIDPHTFEVTLYDRKRRCLPKKDLSSGEKQIFAISLLWGLAKTSGRPLPVIIDTPLGRLDSDHRRNFINNYFPHASHQVIILSTDTEVDESLFEDLGPSVSHCYHLAYDNARRVTSPVEGYFWKEHANA
jgi:DNA sulfur modification protein DndD